MKNKILNSILFVIVTFSIPSFSQEKTVKGYKIEGDFIVFTFDKRDYQTATHEKLQHRLDFSDFDIEKVVVAGNFNNWSRKKWKMKKVDENIYQLKKRIEDFDEDFNWEFKFFINNDFWAEPAKDIANITPAKNKYGLKYNAYNLKILPARINKNGNASFFLEGYDTAKNVVLSGSFNKWDEQSYQMKKVANGWKITLELPADYYEYKFIVDGNWITDPSNPLTTENEYAGLNSVLDIKKEVTFLLKEYVNAEQVILSGSFNNWSETDFKMTKTEKGWEFTTQLSRGKYHYKFIVDGNWKLDPKNSIKEFDGKGNINSVKMVR